LTLLGLLAALVAGGITLLRLRGLRNRNQLLASMVNDRTNNLKEALELKDIYLKEVHHRVKNNLQIIGSLLDLQAEKERLPATQKALSAGRSRIESISLVHKHLHIDANVRHVNLTDFIHEYVTRVEDALMEGEADVEWTLQGDDITLDIEPAQAFGVVLNELLTNSLQHVKTRPLKIDIHWFGDEQKKLHFEYKDNGPGLPEGTGPGTSDALGLNLISSLTKQLKGQVSLSSDNRAHWHFQLSCPFTNEEGRPSS
jgi:two-component sensor histidine kinase